MWQAIWEFQEELGRRRVWTHETVCVEATRLLEERADKPYRHVVVDEAQDLHPVQVHGRPPELRGFAVQKDELDALAHTVRRWLDAGVEPGEIGVAARSNMLADSAAAVLERAAIPVRSLARAQEADDGVRIGTMHRMKGLEFRCVAVVGVSDRQVPPPGAVTPTGEDPLTHSRDLQRERCLLFVACTRAREQLHVSWHGTASSFLAPLVG
ncbi:3'-5' exonuclease [Streptosporangium saharense]|uniref:3'-5' exonuclease n=1 Tax=Streptosporangium saharense TaxID=1706840 RepID=UPI003EB9D672